MEAANMKKMRSVRDLIGDPSSWVNHISDGDGNMPEMDGATIQDIFNSGNQLAIYTRNTAGIEALSIFYIDSAELRERLASLLLPGLNVHDAVAIAIA
jgi:hypothetical protein